MEWEFYGIVLGFTLDFNVYLLLALLHVDVASRPEHLGDGAGYK